MTCKNCYSYPCEKVGTACYNAIRKGEWDKVLELCDNEQKKLTFDSSFATDNAYNEGRLSIIKIIKAELRQAGEL